LGRGLDLESVLRYVGPRLSCGRSGNTDQRWIVFYIERWLQAPLQRKMAAWLPYARSPPARAILLFHQPVLAMRSIVGCSGVSAHRLRAVYCDDVVVHCQSGAAGLHDVLTAIGARGWRCRLTWNMEKTRIVYRKDADRRGLRSMVSVRLWGTRFGPRPPRTSTVRTLSTFTPGGDAPPQAKRCGGSSGVGSSSNE